MGRGGRRKVEDNKYEQKSAQQLGAATGQLLRGRRDWYWYLARERGWVCNYIRYKVGQARKIQKKGRKRKKLRGREKKKGLVVGKNENGLQTTVC